MSTCALCDKGSPLVSAALGMCGQCVRRPESRARAAEVHLRSLESFGLSAPTGEGIGCAQCINACRLAEGEKGLCGLRACRNGRVVPALDHEALVDWYYDPLPTNCVAEWTCAGGKPGCAGLRNLAVFFHGCTFDCLFCQNWHHREGVGELTPRRSVDRLVGCADERTFCVCFFGGDPTPQLDYAFECCDKWIERGAPPRICWETNGSMSQALADRIANYSLGTSGYVKFDLKAFDENLHLALCGTSNRRTLSNFARLGKMRETLDYPLLVASTLLVPGYVDAEEVGSISRFIASIDPGTPYSLLAFHPDYLMDDLPPTSRRQAEECLEAARGAGLENVRLGNVHILY